MGGGRIFDLDETLTLDLSLSRFFFLWKKEQAGKDELM